MRQLGRSVAGRILVVPIALALLLGPGRAAFASRLVLKDGRVLEGRLFRLPSLVEKPAATEAEGLPDLRLIVGCDDYLRRYFIPKRQILQADEAPGEAVEMFNVWQHVARNGSRVAMVGPLLRIAPFDEHGRRWVEMNTNQGKIQVIQGITQIAPLWTKVEGLQVTEGKNFVWDQRIATSSIPRDTLKTILARQIDQEKIDQRLKIVRFYLQSEWYKEAEEELQEITEDFPERKAQFAPTLRDLKQAYARRALAEIHVRRDGGQHRLVLALVKGFPSEGVASETLQAVKQMQDDYQAEYDRWTEVQKKFDAHLALVRDRALADRVRPIRDEIFAELNIHTLDRMAAYQQLWDDATLAPQDKLALAISGWLAGANDATRNLPVALSLVEVRGLVRQYLIEEVKLKRTQIVRDLASQEGASPELVARLLAHLKPPLDTPQPPEEQPGFYELAVDGITGEPPVTYYVQLPPEYDPHRLYPTILTLHGAGSTPGQQIDWWAGGRAADGARQGQASRHGYIVVAPHWAKEHQKEYRFSAEEHAALLHTLRDACRRFSVDTDRVFLSGHSMGGDAAWDIGLAHPDLWAGVIPIVARVDKYIRHYSQNAQYVPLYFVAGELDGDKSVHNAHDLDRYMNRGYNVTVAEFQGRGHEHFSDEILQLFDWMGRYERNFYPREFTCRTMRNWDNYFWWVELEDFPEKTIVAPANWPPPRGTRPASTRATLNATNGIHVSTGAARVTVWLAPDVIDFQRKVTISVNGSRLKASDPLVVPELAVLLEDARTRADRLHPFWAKVEMPAGRVNVAGR